MLDGYDSYKLVAGRNCDAVQCRTYDILLRWLRERVAPAVLVAVHSLLQLMIKVARQEQRNEERNGPNNQHSERSQHTDGGENTKLYTNDIHLRHCVGVVGAVILRVEITFVGTKHPQTQRKHR